jgi:hypothetical protein
MDSTKTTNEDQPAHKNTDKKQTLKRQEEVKKNLKASKLRSKVLKKMLDQMESENDLPYDPG